MSHSRLTWRKKKNNLCLLTKTASYFGWNFTEYLWPRSGVWVSKYGHHAPSHNNPRRGSQERWWTWETDCPLVTSQEQFGELQHVTTKIFFLSTAEIKTVNHCKDTDRKCLYVTCLRIQGSSSRKRRRRKRKLPRQKKPTFWWKSSNCSQ